MSNILMLDINGHYQTIPQDTLDQYLNDSGVHIFGVSKYEIRAFLKGWHSLNKGMPTEKNINKFFEELRNGK